MKVYSGQCSCGELAYEFDGEPINSAFCYCHTCQTATGSDKWFGLWVAADNFRFTKGVPKKYTRLGDSGKETHHMHCQKCACTVCIEITVANMYSVAATSLNEPYEQLPNMAIYTAHAPNWAVFPKDVPKFDVLPPEYSA